MVGYAVRRFLQLIPTLFLITLLLFVGMQAVPGGPMQAFAFNIHMSQAARDAIIHRWGLDQPVGIQYIHWLTSMLTGDWQTSFFRNRPVRDVIGPTLPATLLLMTTAFIIQELHRPAGRHPGGAPALLGVRPGDHALLIRRVLDADVLAGPDAPADLRGRVQDRRRWPASSTSG